MLTLPIILEDFLFTIKQNIKTTYYNRYECIRIGQKYEHIQYRELNLLVINIRERNYYCPPNQILLKIQKRLE